MVPQGPCFVNTRRLAPIPRTPEGRRLFGGAVSASLRPMLSTRLLLLVALCGLLPLAGSCKKKKKTPRELASLSPDQACKHFFRRVKQCATPIHQLQADKLELKGPKRASFIRMRDRQLRESLSKLDLVCERYSLKTRKQQTEMDGCYRERTCDAFARCFTKMADADLRGPGGQKARTLQELRKRLQELKKLRLRKPGAGPGRPPSGLGHKHGPRPGAMLKPKPMTRPKP
jgi:hypothetical protein